MIIILKNLKIYLILVSIRHRPFFFRAQQVAQSMVKEELYTPNGGWGHYPDYHPHYDYYPNATTPHSNIQHQQV